MRRQHWVITRAQLFTLGYSRHAIDHRLATGRLHRVHAGVYAVGRRELTRLGYFMAAVLACGEGAALSQDSAGELWGTRPRRPGPIEVTAPSCHRREGLTVHRGRAEATLRHGIPVTTVLQTLVDLAPRLTRARLERAISEADRLGLTDPERLREGLAAHGRAAAPLRCALDRRTFRLTRSELERRFIPIALRAGLPMPETRATVNGFEVDFWWPDLGLVVETDGLRYHRTPATQTRDLLRDQAHAAAGVERLRFSHEQIAFEAGYVETTLRAVHGRRATTTSERPTAASGAAAANVATKPEPAAASPV